MTKPSTCAGTLFVNVSMPFAGMRLVPDSCYFGYRVIRRNGHLGQPHRRDGFDRHAFAQKPWERLDANNLGVAWRATRRRLRLWCAGASRQWFGVANARPKRQSQLRNCLSRGFQLNDLDNSRDGRRVAGGRRKGVGLAKEDARINFSAAALFRLVWTKTSRTFPSLSTARHI
jgi:hypothetical protein